MQVRQLGEHIGGEITGVDVRHLDDRAFATIYQAWLQFGITVVRDQDLEIAEFLAYGRRFGLVVRHPSKSTRHPDHPEITILGINKFNADGSLNNDIYRRGASHFHTDGAYDDIPFKATKLYAVAIPSRGGDTLFSCMHRALETLPERLRCVLEGRRAAYTYGGRTAEHALLNPADRTRSPAFHDLIRTHSETGRKSLYFDPGKIQYIEGLEPQHSDDVIEALTTHMIVPGAGYVHKWRQGDVVIWDNRCLVHKAAGDYPPEENRIHWRLSIKEPEAAHASPAQDRPWC